MDYQGEPWFCAKCDWDGSRCEICNGTGEFAVTPELIDEIRAWVADCEWGDLDEDAIADMSPDDLLRGVDRNYAGGVTQFYVDSGLAPVQN
jgi:hypothetical protein